MDRFPRNLSIFVEWLPIMEINSIIKYFIPFGGSP